MRLESTKNIAKKIEWKKISCGYCSDVYGENDVIHLKQTTPFAIKEEIIVVCNKTDFAIIKMFLGNRDSYNVACFEKCESICRKINSLEGTCYEIMGWNGRIVLLDKIIWKEKTKKELKEHIEKMAEIVCKIKKELNTINY